MLPKNQAARQGVRNLSAGGLATVPFLALFLASSAILLTITSDLTAATYYMVPNGSDSNPGSSESPWKTFDHSVNKLQPGDVLVLKNGTYTGSANGILRINPSSGIGVNGTSSKPIRVRAENERQAHLKSNGSYIALEIDNASYWIFEGLRVSSADFDVGSTSADRSNVRARFSSNLTFRRLLLHHSNRYTNSLLLRFVTVHNSLVEECEFYNFHRHAVSFFGGSNSNIARRLYGNSRGYGDIEDGRETTNPASGDHLVMVYPGSNNIVENCISENNKGPFGISATGRAENNRMLGNISLNDAHGTRIVSRGNTADQTPRNNFVRDLVVINAGNPGLYSRSAFNTVVENSTFIGCQRGVHADKRNQTPGDGNYSIFVTNVLSLSNTEDGFRITSDIQDWKIDSSNAYLNKTAYSPAFHTNLVNSQKMDPKLGSCLLWIPDGSPMKGAGLNGADIGANIIYRYENGKLTDKLLWSPGFPCGRQIPGINDIPGKSCFDVHKRLNAGVNGCAIPSGSTPTRSPPSRPTHLRVVSSLH